MYNFLALLCYAIFRAASITETQNISKQSRVLLVHHTQHNYQQTKKNNTNYVICRLSIAVWKLMAHGYFQMTLK